MPLSGQLLDTPRTGRNKVKNGVTMTCRRRAGPRPIRGRPASGACAAARRFRIGKTGRLLDMLNLQGFWQDRTAAPHARDAGFRVEVAASFPDRHRRDAAGRHPDRRKKAELRLTARIHKTTSKAPIRQYCCQNPTGTAAARPATDSFRPKRGFDSANIADLVNPAGRCTRAAPRQVRAGALGARPVGSRTICGLLRN